MPNPASSPAASIDRRAALKLGLASLAGLWLAEFIPPGFASAEELPEQQQGRVISANISIHPEPSFKSQEIKKYWRDTILPITLVTIGDSEPVHNRVWYKIGEEGYAHSGNIQPVRTQLNDPPAEIRPGGMLAEVTVPFTDAHFRAGKEYGVAYRYYYETTHWVDRIIHDRTGAPWYRVREDKWEMIFFVPQEHLRILPDEELTPISPDVPMIGKRLEVRLQDQLVIAYEWNQPVFMSKASTGSKFSNGNYATPYGRFFTNHKRPSRHMAAGDIASNGYDLPGVPWVSYITESGIAFHGTYWHNDFGQPRSHGCINLPSQASRWLYRWTLPQVPTTEQRIYEETGTPVDVI